MSLSFLISLFGHLQLTKSRLTSTLSYVVDRIWIKAQLQKCQTWWERENHYKGEFTTVTLLQFPTQRPGSLIKDTRDGKGPLGHQTYPLTKGRKWIQATPSAGFKPHSGKKGPAAALDALFYDTGCHLYKKTWNELSAPSILESQNRL